MEYLLFIVFIGIFLIVLFVRAYLQARRKRREFYESLSRDYGVLREKDYFPGKMEAIRRFFELHPKEGQIDEITWNDLSMDDVYKNMNYPFSSAGEEYLYYTLRTPETDEGVLKEREEKIRFFSENEKIRTDLLFAISKMGFSGKYSIYDYINNLDILGTPSNLKHYLTILLLVAGASAFFVNLPMGILCVCVVLCYNIVTYFKSKKDIDPYITSFAYIMRLLEACDEICKIEGDGWAREREEIAKAKNGLNRFRRGSFWIMSSGRMSGSGNPLDLIFDYIRMMFHVDIIQFNKMLCEVQAHKDEIDCMLTKIGEIEMEIAVGAYRNGLGELFCVPTLSEKLEITDAVHPCLLNAVPNGITTEKGVLLTGSNASGKSTFLKTIAINTLLSETIHTAVAKSFGRPLCYIYSSMALRDDLIGAESYYIVEIKSIKRILDAAKGDVPVLCFVDEVLRGTNTVERIAASTQILKMLREKKVFCFAATHDIELASLLKEWYDNFHFEEEIKDGDVVFSYMIHEGEAKTRNAIRLLSVMGYEEDIISQAERMANDFLNNGKWEMAKGK